MRWKTRFYLAFCFTIIFSFFCTLAYPSVLTTQKTEKEIKPKVHNGVINLTDFDFKKDGPVKLNGEWEFYWNQLLSPDDFKTDASRTITGFFNVPGSWNHYKKKKKLFAGHGYATYRLRIKLKKDRAYALKILPISTAYRLWVDGESISVGKVGKKQQEMIPQSGVKIIRFHPDNPEAQIVLQISNFYHRSGGPRRSLEVGLYEQISEQRIKSFAFDLFLIGSILMIGIYHFALFVLRRKDIAALYFGALCLAGVIRAFVTSEHVFYFLFPGFNWLISYKFVYISFYLAVSFAVLFINNLYPDEALAKTSKISAGIAIIFSLIVVFTQPQLFSHTVKAYQIITIISLLYMAYVIFRAVLNNQSGALLVAAGSIIIAVTVINDILYAKEIIISFYMAPLGLLVFILFHSLNLSIKFSNAFSNIEIVEEKYRSVFENSLDGIFQISLLDRTYIANPALVNVLGFSTVKELDALVEEGWEQVFADSSVYDQYLTELNVNKQVKEFEAEFHCKDGNTKWVSINSKAKTDRNDNIWLIDSMIHDITHRKEKEMLEAKMVQVQKMEAVGHLAGGIAHDFHNIISAISSNTQVLRMDKDSISVKNEKRFLNIIDACDRATSLINQILTFSKKNKKDSFKPIKIDLIIKEVTRFIRNIIPITIEIEQDIDSQSFKILSDSTQIYQVLMNLYYNAIDAMEKTGGILKVALSPVEIEDMKIATGYLSKGDYVVLAVSDTGEGIPPEIINKIFDPYYTTKEQGKGTGLGLATVHGIVKSHGGEIEVRSKQGKGTIFQIYFPVTDKEEQKTEYDEDQIEIKGQGKILFVDDEEVITDSFGELLDTLGFDVDTYVTPENALKRVKENLYDVIITDFQMPGINGVEFARKVREKDKRVKIIICSGDLSSITREEFNSLDLYSIIQKPLEYGELAHLIQQAINSK
jgi:PAS domain S-box-containing protein